MSHSFKIMLRKQYEYEQELQKKACDFILQTQMDSNDVDTNIDALLRDLRTYEHVTMPPEYKLSILRELILLKLSILYSS